MLIVFISFPRESLSIFFVHLKTDNCRKTARDAVPSKDRGYDNLSVFTGVSLGAIAAVAVVIFLLIGALMKVVLGTLRCIGFGLLWFTTLWLCNIAMV